MITTNDIKATMNINKLFGWNNLIIEVCDLNFVENYVKCHEYHREWNRYLNIIIHVIASQLFGHCDVIDNWLWRHQQNKNWASEAVYRSSFLSSFMDSLCCVRNKIMHVLSWRTVSARSNSWNKHQNNPLVSAETVHRPSTYIILYIPCIFFQCC